MSFDFKELNKKGVLSYYNIEKCGISAFTLKMIAVITMIVDHVGVVLLRGNPEYYELFRTIGRLSFPIYAFLLVEGFFHTSDRKKYAMRLGVFALISEVPYDLAFYGQAVYGEAQNIFFTLLLGLLAVCALNAVTMGSIKYPEKIQNVIGYINLQSISRIVVMLGFCGMAHIFNCSYSYAGVFIIMCFYVFYPHHIGRMFANVFFNMGMYGGVQSYGALSIIPIALYNGEQGKRKWKWFFYWIYPVHLLMLRMIFINL